MTVHLLGGVVETGLHGLPSPFPGVDITDELHRRPSRRPDYETESRVVTELTRAVEGDPQSLVEIIGRCCRAGSCGILIAEPGNGARADWRAAAGAWAPNLGRGWSQAGRPGRATLNGHPILIRPDADDGVGASGLPLVEALIVPLPPDDRHVGMVWLVSHDERHRFDAEDARLASSLTRVAFLAYRARRADGVRMSRTRAVDMAGGHDRTELQLARLALKQSEERYRRLVDLLPVGVYTCAAPSGRITFFNDEAAALWGRRPLIDEPDDRFCGSLKLQWPDGRPLPHDETPMALAIREGRPFQNEEVVIERADGTRVTVLVNIDILKDAEGCVTGAVNVFHDVTALKEAENKLRDGEQRFRMMIDSLPAAIYTTDAEGRVTHFNPAAVAFSGNTPELGSDKWCVSWKLYHADGTPMPHDQCPMAIALREGRVLRGCEAIAETPTGVRRHFEAYPTPLRDGEGRLVGGINMLVDITERKRYEEQMRTVMKELSHRVKNTLAVIQSVASQTARRASDLESFRTSLEERIRAMASAHSLLTQSSWSGAALDDIVRSEIVPRLASDDQATIGGPSVTLRPDATLAMHMIIHELATNAVKYGALRNEAGRIAITWTIEREGAVSELCLDWQERCSDRVDGAGASGYGSYLIEQVVGYELGGTIEHELRAEGLRCSITFPLTGVDGAAVVHGPERREGASAWARSMERTH